MLPIPRALATLPRKEKSNADQPLLLVIYGLCLAMLAGSRSSFSAQASLLCAEVYIPRLLQYVKIDTISILGGAEDKLRADGFDNQYEDTCIRSTPVSMIHTCDVMADS